MKSLSNILIFFLLAVPGFAQITNTEPQQPIDTATVDQTPQKKDTIRLTWNDYKPTGIRFGTDLIAIAKNKYVSTFNGWEVNGDIDFFRYYLTMDYGHWARNFSGSSIYKNDGTYYRVGIDASFLKKDPDRNMLFFGIRYGHSNFTEYLADTIKDPIWGTVLRQYNNSNSRAGWLELTGGLRMKVWKFIWLGYTARFKFGLHYRNVPEMIPFDVPGYGRTDKTSYWGFNYQIFFRIPIRKAPPNPYAKPQ